MTRIDFYILPDMQVEAREHFACRLIDKAVRMGNQVFVATDSPDEADKFNRLLWDFQPHSFVPHKLLNQASPASPVEIGHSQSCGSHHDLLINLCTDIPPYFSQFTRLIEVVCQDERILDDTRKHFTFYRDRGYPLNSHDMRKSKGMAKQ